MLFYKFSPRLFLINKFNYILKYTKNTIILLISYFRLNF